MRHLAIAFACLLGLAACSTSQTAAVTTSLATAQTDLTKAVSYYGISKGMALAAEVAQPTLKPSIDKAIAVLDPTVATAQAALAAATMDAPAAEAMAQQIISQVTSLTVMVAPAVKVVAGK